MSDMFNFNSLSFTDFTVELPKEWSIMKNSDNLVVVQLKATDSEYSSVNDRFQDVGKREVVKVRVVNYLVLFMLLAFKTFTEDRHLSCLLGLLQYAPSLTSCISPKEIDHVNLSAAF